MFFRERNDSNENFVASVNDRHVVIICHTKEGVRALKGVGARNSWISAITWRIKYESESHLAAVLSHLRDKGIMFSGGSTWSPAAIFVDLRNRGLLQGQFLHITWKGPKQPVISVE